MKESRRTYSSPLQYFHNYEHDPEGRTHCKGPASHPYRIAHEDRKHRITHQYAKGHGKGGKTQWFRFPKRLGTGYDLSSGIKVAGPPSEFLEKSKKKKKKKARRR